MLITLLASVAFLAVTAVFIRFKLEEQKRSEAIAAFVKQHEQKTALMRQAREIALGNPVYRQLVEQSRLQNRESKSAKNPAGVRR